MNESVGSSSNGTKVNPTDDILCAVNNNFVNTANNEFFNAVNKEFLNEIKSPSQLNEHEPYKHTTWIPRRFNAESTWCVCTEVNTNITDIDFIVNCSTKNTDRVILNTDNTSDEEGLSESYLENYLLSEAKLDSTFLSIQFLINGFSVPHR